VFLQCMCMSREDSAREPENPKVRGRNGITNQSGPIGFSHELTASNSTFSSSIAEQDHKSPRRLPLQPFSTHCNSWQASSSTTESRRRRAHLIVANPIHRGNSLPFVLLHNKVCPDSLNLSNAGDSFAGISSLTSCYLFSRTRDWIAMF
jgi:hypothetical protein